MALVLTNTSTPVPLRIAKRILTGIIIVSAASVAAAALHSGLEFTYEQGVETSLSRIASLTLTAKARAVEPKLLASAKENMPAKKEPYFMKPAKGIDWGILHSNNGVDIANSCGTQVVAAASGKVSEIGSGWNGGYGNSVRIKHGNGTETYYAHLTDIEVVSGETVAQGQKIGTIGITGKATGCHLHFEVHGDTNPFGK